VLVSVPPNGEPQKTAQVPDSNSKFDSGSPVPRVSSVEGHPIRDHARGDHAITREWVTSSGSRDAYIFQGELGELYGISISIYLIYISKCSSPMQFPMRFPVIRSGNRYGLPVGASDNHAVIEIVVSYSDLHFPA